MRRATVRPAGPDDVAAIMGLERRPGFDAFVGRSDEAEHRAMLAGPASPIGSGSRRTARRSPSRSSPASATRTATSTSSASPRSVPARGSGRRSSALVLDEAFGDLGAWRFHLDCFAGNARAQSAYAKLGFTRDGVLRQAYRMPDGTRTDLVLMALLKPEWEARRGGGPSVS